MIDSVRNRRLSTHMISTQRGMDYKKKCVLLFFFLSSYIACLSLFSRYFTSLRVLPHRYFSCYFNDRNVFPNRYRCVQARECIGISRDAAWNLSPLIVQAPEAAVYICTGMRHDCRFEMFKLQAQHYNHVSLFLCAFTQLPAACLFAQIEIMGDWCRVKIPKRINTKCDFKGGGKKNVCLCLLSRFKATFCVISLLRVLCASFGTIKIQNTVSVVHIYVTKL